MNEKHSIGQISFGVSLQELDPTHLAVRAPPVWPKAPEHTPHSPVVRKFMKFRPMVEALAALSKDPSTKVASIAFDDNYNIISTGFNGFPRGVADLPERYENREVKIRLISHSEQNLVAQSAYRGTSLKGATVVLSALFPCSACAKSLIQAGVIRVISPPPDTNERWVEEAKWATLMFEEAGVEVVHYE